MEETEKLYALITVQFGVVVKLWNFIPEIPGSNLGQIFGFP